MFATVISRTADKIRQESKWAIMFADNIVLCGESHKEVTAELEGWKYALERRGMKVSWSKTKYLCK